MQPPYRQAERVTKVLDGRTLVCAESCTAGLLTQALAAQEGSAEWLRGGVVAYQAEVKRALLGVEAKNIFSVDAAEQMATGVAELLGAQVAVATTGVAGPEPDRALSPAPSWWLGRSTAPSARPSCTSTATHATSATLPPGPRSTCWPPP